MFIVTLSQFILLQLELKKIIDFQYTIHNWPVFLYPVGAIYTFIYARKEDKKQNLPKTIIGNMLGTLGGIIGMNLMILGHFFWQNLGDARYPVFLILLAIFLFVSGISIKFKPIIIGGIMLNLIGFAAFYIDWKYHFLIMSIASVLALIIPGILLNIEKRREHV